MTRSERLQTALSTLIWCSESPSWEPWGSPEEFRRRLECASVWQPPEYMVIRRFRQFLAQEANDE